MSLNDLYEFAAATTDVPWAEAEACGWFNCPDVGGWLRSVTEDEVRYGAGGRDAAIERMIAVKDAAWKAAFKGAPTLDFDHHAYFSALLDAAGGER